MPRFMILSVPREGSYKACINLVTANHTLGSRACYHADPRDGCMQKRRDKIFRDDKIKRHLVLSLGKSEH